jgi:hypothetical protein
MSFTFATKATTRYMDQLISPRKSGAAAWAARVVGPAHESRNHPAVSLQSLSTPSARHPPASPFLIRPAPPPPLPPLPKSDGRLPRRRGRGRHRLVVRLAVVLLLRQGIEARPPPSGEEGGGRQRPMRQQPSGHRNFFQDESTTKCQYGQAASWLSVS